MSDPSTSSASTKPVTEEMIERLRYLAADFRKNELMLTDEFADAIDAVLKERGKDKDEIRLLGKALKGANDDFLELKADVEKLRAACMAVVRAYASGQAYDKSPLSVVQAALAATEPKVAALSAVEGAPDNEKGR